MEVIWSGWDVLHPRLKSPYRLHQACAKCEKVFFLCVKSCPERLQLCVKLVLDSTNHRC